MGTVLAGSYPLLQVDENVRTQSFYRKSRRNLLHINFAAFGL